MKRWGFRTRVLAAALIPVVLMAVALAVFFTQNRISDQESSLRERGLTMARQLAPASEFGVFSGNRDNLQALVESARREADVDGVAVLDADGHLLALGGAVHLAQAGEANRVSEARLLVSDDTDYLFAAPVGAQQIAADDLFEASQPGVQAKPLGVVLVQMSRRGLVSVRQELMLSAALITVLGLIVSGLIARWLSAGVTDPVRRLAETVTQIGLGNFSARASIGMGGILGGLQDGINRMAESLGSSRAELERRVEEATAELKAQKEVAEAANRAKSQFVGAMVHDLSQPLMAMGLDIRTLKLSCFDRTAAALLERLERSALKLENMRDGLLDIARLESGATQPHLTEFPIQRVFDSVGQTFDAQARECGLSLRWRTSPLWCVSDPLLLERVLANLVSNALRYTAHGGVLVGVRERGETLHVEVWDSGRGIPQDKLQEVFVEFVTLGAVHGSSDGARPARGMGLGLSIVERLCHLMGHGITVRSREGRGSMFRVSLPRAHPVSIAPEAEPMRGLERLRGQRVALIDDDSAVMESLRALLLASEVDVIAGTSPEFVLRQLRQTGAPVFIISDYQLGHGQNGLQAVLAIRREFDRPIPALIVSGLSSSRDLEIELERHGIPLIAKPVRPAVLDAVVGVVLDAAEEGAGEDWAF